MLPLTIIYFAKYPGLDFMLHFLFSLPRWLEITTQAQGRRCHTLPRYNLHLGFVLSNNNGPQEFNLQFFLCISSLSLSRRYVKERTKQTMTHPIHDLFTIWECSPVSWCSWSCICPMTPKLCCYMGCSMVLYDSQLICFALSFINLLAVFPDGCSKSHFSPMCWLAQRIFIIRIIFFYDVFSSFWFLDWIWFSSITWLFELKIRIRFECRSLFIICHYLREEVRTERWKNKTVSWF